jgi:hypothetical protein
VITWLPPYGTFNIHDNAPGCNSPSEVLAACNAMFGCLPDGITFSTQAEIDNFQTNYPGCTEIQGDVTISGSDITNLNGLNVVNYISGNLIIGNAQLAQANPVLNNLEGLESLTAIGGNLVVIHNSVLDSLSAYNRSG